MLILCATAAVSLSCTKDEGKSREQLRQEEKNRTIETVKALANKHAADVEWLARIGDDPGEAYTIQWQKALLDHPERSYLLLASVVDIRRHNDTYLLYAYESWSGSVYYLECSPEQVKYVEDTTAERRHSYYYGSNYALIIKPDNVYRYNAQYSLEVEGDGDEDHSWVNAYVDSDVPGQVIVLGTCIDIVLMEDTYMDSGDMATVYAE